MRRLALLLLALFLVAVPPLALHAQPLPWLTSRLAARFLPGLSIEGQEGGMPTRFAAARVTYADAQGVWLTLERPELRFALSNLLRGRVVLSLVTAESITVSRWPVAAEGAPADAPGGPLLPQLPVAVELRDVKLPRILLPEARLALEGNATLADGELELRLAARELEGPGRLDVQARFDGARLAADLTAEEPAGTLTGAPLSARLHLDGPASGAEWRLDARYGEAAAALTGTIAREPTATRLAGSGTVEAAAFLPEALRPLATGARIAFAGRYADDGRLTLDPTTLEAPAGTLQLTGDALPALALDVALDLAASERFTGLLPPGLGWQALTARARVTGAPAHPLIEARVTPEALATGIALADAALGPTPALTLRLTPDLAGSRVTLEGPAVAATVEGDFGDTLDVRGEVRLAATAPAGPALPPAPGAPRPDLSSRVEEDARTGPPPARPDRPATPPPGGNAASAPVPSPPAPPGAPLGPIEGSATLRFTARGPRTDPALTLDLAAPRLRAPLGTTTVTADALALRAEVLNPLTAPRGTASGGGRVMGLPLNLDIAAQPETVAGIPGARISRGALSFGPARLALSGLVQPQGKPADPADGPRVGGEAKLEVPDLAPFSALAGQPLAGAVTVEANGDSAAEWRLRIAAPRLGAAGQEGRGTLVLNGRGPQVRAALEAGNPVAELRLAATTTLALPLLAEVQQLSVASQGESLRITAPLRVRVDGANYALENLNATTGQGGRITGNLAARGTEQALSGQLAFSGLPLSLARLAAPEIPLRGQFGGEARFGGTLAVPDVALTLRGQGLGADTAQLRRLPPATLSAEARLRGQAIEGRANLAAGPAIRLDATVRMPDAQSLNATLNGELDVAPLADIALAGGADRVTGRVSLALRAEGPVAAPQLSGAATLRNLNYANGETGLRLDNINGRLVANGDRLQLQGVNGRTPDGGTVALAGSVAPLEATIPVDITLTARRATLVNPDLGQAAVNADLSLRGALRERARFSGTITVTGGELRVPDRLPNSVPVLVPFREVGRTPPGRAPPRRPATAARRGRGAPAAPPPPAAFNVDLAVRLDVPGRLYLRGRGLETELVGRLDVAGTLAEPQVSGDLRTRRGTLDVLGKRLELTRGVVKWDAGGFIPSLDILASTRTSTHSITVAITGLANAPEVQLGSSPDLPQDEVVARLLFDRATSSLSPFEIIQIAQAVGQLAGVEPPGGGVDGALGRVRRFLGLDRLNAGGDQRGGTAVQAGNYIAPGVYLGLQSGSTGTGLGVQAEIAPGLKLEGSAGTSTSRLGMTYEFEW